MCGDERYEKAGLEVHWDGAYPENRGDERGQGSAPGREVRGRRNCIGLLPIDGQVTLRGDSPPGVAS